MTSIAAANVTPTGDWDYTGGSIAVPTPSASTQAANKTYVDSAGHAIFTGNNAGGTISSSETDRFQTVNGSKSEDTDVDDTYIVISNNATWKRGYVRVQSNSLDSNTLFTSHINGSDGNIVITIPSSTSGTFSDTSNTDSINAGDLIAWHITHSAGGGSAGHVSWGSQLTP